MPKSRKIAFVGGGTAGHIGKLLAVMQAVYDEAAAKGVVVECVYIGMASDLQSPLMSISTLPTQRYAIHAGKLNRYVTLTQLGEFVRFARGTVEARSLLKKIKPDCIFTNGGYVTVPIAMAAARLHIPLVTHETDVVPGLANRMIARSAAKICTTYPAEYYTAFPAEKLEVVGQPVRAEFYQDASNEPLIIEGREVRGPLITVVGGSQGAHRLNELVAGAWLAILSEASIIHITGQREYGALLERRKVLPESARDKLFLLAFSDQLAHFFWKSTLVISRAGGTVAEIAATRRAAVLVPLSTAAQDHQRANAKVLEEAGAARVIDEEKASEEVMTAVIHQLLNSPEERTLLSERIAAFDHPDAAKKLATLLLSDTISA